MSVTTSASGRVFVVVSVLWVSAQGSDNVWALRDGTTEVAGSYTYMGFQSGGFRQAARMYITGLTPGTSYTWKWAYRVSAGTAQIYYGDNGSSSGLGPRSWRSGRLIGLLTGRREARGLPDLRKGTPSDSATASDACT